MTAPAPASARLAPPWCPGEEGHSGLKLTGDRSLGATRQARLVLSRRQTSPPWASGIAAPICVLVPAAPRSRRMRCGPRGACASVPDPASAGTAR